MNGNTITSSSCLKTRRFDSILKEAREFFAVHEALGLTRTYPGGIHFEMTGKHVSECVGGTKGIAKEDLGERYHSNCDSRSNADQALENAFLVAESLKEARKK